ncbi:MAG: hypothetical protein ACE5SW_01095 [Nitrososphaeraceae archaeon]
MFRIILENLIKSKNIYFDQINPKSIISEIIPISYSKKFPINTLMLGKLHQFTNNNSIYFKKTCVSIDNTGFISYEGDVNNFYLNAKKYDTSYQPFYPTWILSSLLLCEWLRSDQTCSNEIIDIGSGDGRIPYCGSLLGIRSIGLEIDSSLIDLQKFISKKTNINFEIINADATTYDFSNLELYRPCFVISALPEMGEMFIENIMKRIKENKIKSYLIVLLGSLVKRKFSNNNDYFGWGDIIENNNLTIIHSINLPTHWTNHNAHDTKYLIVKSK